MKLHPEPEKVLGPSAEPDRMRPAVGEQEDWFRDLVAHSHDLLCIHDLQGRLLSVNPAPAHLLGYSVEEILQIPMRDLIAPDFQKEFDDYLKQVERNGEAHGFAAVMTRSGERLIWQYHSSLRTEGVASPVVRDVAHDVTAEKQSEERLREVGEELLVKVRESERTIRELKLFRALVDQSNDAIEVIDPQTFRFLDVNHKACSELGYSREELLSMGVFDIDPAVTESSVTKILEELRKSGSIVMESLHRRKDGITFPVELSMKRVQLDREYVIATSRDLTERKLAESRLRASQERYRAVHDRSPVGICWIETATGWFLGVNPKYCEIAGRTEGDLLGRDFQSITHPDDLAENLELMRQLADGEVRHYEMEKRYVRPDGSVRWVTVEVVAMCPEGESPVWHMAIVQDITESKRAEARLKEYERVVEGLDENIAVVDRDHRIVIANRSFLSDRNLEKEQVIGRKVGEVAGEQLFENVLKARFDECFQGRVVRFEYKRQYPRLGERDLLTSFFPIEGPCGVDRVAVILQDVTERKRAEARLREYERVVEGLEEMITVVDRDYRYVIANRAYLTYRGSGNEQVVGRRLDEVVDPEVFERVCKPRLDECFRGKVVQYEMKYTYPTLGERDLLISYFPIEGPTGVDRIASVMQDITDRKRAEEALRDAREFSENLIRTANVIVLCLDMDGNITLLNQAAELITGYTSSELQGKNWSILVPRDRFPHAWEEFDRLVAGTAGPTYENPIITKTGEERYISWRNNLVKVNGKVVATISFGNDFTERKQTEEALRRSEENYRLFVSQSSEGIFREEMDAPVSIDLPEDELVQHIIHDSYMGECNDAMARMYGFESGKELVGMRLTEMLVADDPHNIELTRHYIRTGFRVLERESHEVDIHGNPKVFVNSMIGIVENGMLVRTWGIQRDVTEKAKLEESRRQAEEALSQNVTQLREVTEELRLAKEKLAEEKLYLEEAIDTELGFGEIVGRSKALQDVMQKVAKVAPSDATVLLLGETGTGKELVARALHRLSQRHGNSFIKMNCAAIPSGLLESELFGHEKGAFTGAVARKVGRLELADKGTLFLDEIGEIPLSLQPKLLRVLQDMEFERLGGTQTLKVDFRLLAATNRDLLQSVNSREFRSDLYYRLNVFPIVIPPLRERREDIRPLVEHFVRKFATQMKKSITSIPTKTMEVLMRWRWPGNIRELENFLERSVILTPGSVLQAPLAELEIAEEEGDRTGKDNLHEKEREHILRALRECKGKLGGPDGAAARLGLKRTTLQSKLDQLGIKPGTYRA